MYNDLEISEYGNKTDKKKIRFGKLIIKNKGIKNKQIKFKKYIDLKKPNTKAKQGDIIYITKKSKKSSFNTVEFVGRVFEVEDNQEIVKNITEVICLDTNKYTTIKAKDENGFTYSYMVSHDQYRILDFYKGGGK